MFKNLTSYDPYVRKTISPLPMPGTATIYNRVTREPPRSRRQNQQLAQPRSASAHAPRHGTPAHLFLALSCVDPTERMCALALWW